MRLAMSLDQSIPSENLFGLQSAPSKTIEESNECSVAMPPFAGIEAKFHQRAGFGSRWETNGLVIECIPIDDNFLTIVIRPIRRYATDWSQAEIVRFRCRWTLEKNRHVVLRRVPEERHGRTLIAERSSIGHVRRVLTVGIDQLRAPVSYTHLTLPTILRV